MFILELVQTEIRKMCEKIWFIVGIGEKQGETELNYGGDVKLFML